MNQQTILVADDNKEVVQSLSKLLEYESYKVIKAHDGIEALETLVEHKIDLIILDIMMPRMNGLSAMMKIRETNKIPIIILSAKTEESDMVSGLTMGADDYVAKPYNTSELMARVQAQLRRYLVWSEGQPKRKKNLIINGGIVLDKNAKNMIVDGNEVKLTATEYKISELLMSNMGYVFSAEEIYQKVWDQSKAYAVENTVMVHISRIRDKIEIDAKNPKYLKVVWGIGYKVENYNNRSK